jgi:hypothetical protein
VLKKGLAMEFCSAQGAVLVIMFVFVLLIIAFTVFRKKKPAEEPCVDDYQQRLAEYDSYEGSFYDAEDPIKVSCTLQINYISGEGKQTTRTIRVKEFSKTLHGGLILAHCHLRNENRTFRTDRIRSCIDTETNKSIPNIAEYLLEKYESSYQAKADKMLETYYDHLSILIYAAKLDGQLRKEERLVIREACRSIVQEPELSDDVLDEIIAKIDPPSLRNFQLAVGRIVKCQVSSPVDLIATVTKIIDTQKTRAPSEEECIHYLVKKLKSKTGVNNE